MNGRNGGAHAADRLRFPLSITQQSLLLLLVLLLLLPLLLLPLLLLPLPELTEKFSFGGLGGRGLGGGGAWPTKRMSLNEGTRVAAALPALPPLSLGRLRAAAPGGVVAPEK
jgi:hypothetical protein